MIYALITFGIGVILFFVKRMIDSARADRAIARTAEDAAKAEAYITELTQLMQEIENAKIAYNSSKRALEQSGTGAGLQSGDSQRGQGN